MNGTPHRWDSWAQVAAVIIVLLAALWNVSGQLATMRQQLADLTDQTKENAVRLERLENRYPFPAPERVR